MRPKPQESPFALALHVPGSDLGNVTCFCKVQKIRYFKWWVECLFPLRLGRSRCLWELTVYLRGGSLRLMWFMIIFMYRCYQLSNVGITFRNISAAHQADHPALQPEQLELLSWENISCGLAHLLWKENSYDTDRARSWSVENPSNH